MKAAITAISERPPNTRRREISVCHRQLSGDRILAAMSHQVFWTWHFLLNTMSMSAIVAWRIMIPFLKTTPSEKIGTIRVIKPIWKSNISTATQMWNCRRALVVSSIDSDQGLVNHQWSRYPNSMIFPLRRSKKKFASLQNSNLISRAIDFIESYIDQQRCIYIRTSSR